MAALRNNAAYDLSLFEPKEEQVLPEEPKKVVKKTRAKASVHPAQAIRWAAAGCFAVLSLMAIMFCNVQLTDLNDQISQQKSQLESAKSENVRLNVQLESRMSLDNVESNAVGKLGMQKATSYQINYIHLADSDRVDVSRPSAGFFDRILNWILEYL